MTDDRSVIRKNRHPKNKKQNETTSSYSSQIPAFAVIRYAFVKLCFTSEIFPIPIQSPSFQMSHQSRIHPDLFWSHVCFDSKKILVLNYFLCCFVCNEFESIFPRRLLSFIIINDTAWFAFVRIGIVAVIYLFANSFRCLYIHEFITVKLLKYQWYFNLYLN